MIYRTCKASGNKLSALGFGCMRFPQMGGEAERMVLAAIESGVNFFDTAYIYPNSEKTLGAILNKHGLRQKVFIATKMPISMTKSYADFDKYFNEQLRRLKTDYIDYYLIHNISNFTQWEMTRELGIFEWLAGKKASGQIRHVGFSYHGSGEDFPRVLDSYAWEFCMLQYNYYDENYQAGKKGLQLASEKGLSVLVMEPLLGGRLATGLPKKAEEAFRAADPKKSPAEHAFRWVWNHEEVTVTLSGMTSEKQARENIHAFSNFTPLQPADLSVYAQVISIFQKSFKVKCTGCNYCLPCPKQIDIPARLSAYNASFAQSYFTGLLMYYTGMGIMSRNPISVHLCNNCGKCEKNCPQHIPIRKELKKVATRFESLPFRLLLKAVKFVLR
ncbi:MAG: aldo/keto reductase [Defluviitaleaceae bacterium]|nr:aldo/keto reductase [Defluviitaleaceae bacterium]MCL2263152.1 aldo/keto reductase [Defluviitaleaceae bacterium]